MNYFAWSIAFTIAAFVNFLLAPPGVQAAMPWWVYALLAVACTAAAIHAGHWSRKTRRGS